MRRHVWSALFLIVLFALVNGFGADAKEATEKKGDAMKTAARPSRAMETSKTFSPAAAEFLRQPFASQLVTINPKGSPQVTVMWFKYEDGAILFTTTTDRVKFRNMQKDPRATLAVVDPANMYKWVIVHGKFSVDKRDPEAFYRGLAEHYLTGEGLEAWKKTAQMENRTVLKLTPTQVRTMGLAKEP
jgi:PPOX class probable F420-dependent enzyme